MASRHTNELFARLEQENAVHDRHEALFIKLGVQDDTSISSPRPVSNSLSSTTTSKILFQSENDQSIAPNDTTDGMIETPITHRLQSRNGPKRSQATLFDIDNTDEFPLKADPANTVSEPFVPQVVVSTAFIRQDGSLVTPTPHTSSKSHSSKANNIEQQHAQTTSIASTSTSPTSTSHRRSVRFSDLPEDLESSAAQSPQHNEHQIVVSPRHEPTLSVLSTTTNPQFPAQNIVQSNRAIAERSAWPGACALFSFPTFKLNDPSVNYSQRNDDSSDDEYACYIAQRPKPRFQQPYDPQFHNEQRMSELISMPFFRKSPSSSTKSANQTKNKQYMISDHIMASSTEELSQIKASSQQKRTEILSKQQTQYISQPTSPSTNAKSTPSHQSIIPPLTNPGNQFCPTTRAARKAQRKNTFTSFVLDLMKDDNVLPPCEMARIRNDNVIAALLFTFSFLDRSKRGTIFKDVAYKHFVSLCLLTQQLFNERQEIFDAARFLNQKETFMSRLLYAGGVDSESIDCNTWRFFIQDFDANDDDFAFVLDQYLRQDELWVQQHPVALDIPPNASTSYIADEQHMNHKGVAQVDGELLLVAESRLDNDRAISPSLSEMYPVRLFGVESCLSRPRTYTSIQSMNQTESVPQI